MNSYRISPSVISREYSICSPAVWFVLFVLFSWVYGICWVIDCVLKCYEKVILMYLWILSLVEFVFDVYMCIYLCAFPCDCCPFPLCSSFLFLFFSFFISFCMVRTCTVNRLYTHTHTPIDDWQGIASKHWKCHSKMIIHSKLYLSIPLAASHRR